MHMKRVLIMSFLLVSAHVAFCQQEIKNDPTYSANNYKHPNKAAYAREHNLDNSIFLPTATVSLTANYKQPYNKIETKVTALPVRRVEKTMKSYKHPQGL